MLVQEEQGPRPKVAVSRQYWALDEKAVGLFDGSSSAEMRDVTVLFVGRSEKIRK